jgi:hypothetical protein
MRRFAGSAGSMSRRAMFEPHQRVLALVAERLRRTVPAPAPDRLSLAAQLGRATIHLARQLHRHGTFVGQVVSSSPRFSTPLLRRPPRGRSTFGEQGCMS